MTPPATMANILAMCRPCATLPQRNAGNHPNLGQCARRYGIMREGATANLTPVSSICHRPAGAVGDSANPLPPCTSTASNTTWRWMHPARVHRQMGPGPGAGALSADGAIRQQKARDFKTALWWAERGVTIYGTDCARPEAVEDLQKRADHFRQKLNPQPRPSRPRPVRSGVVRGSRDVGFEPRVGQPCRSRS